jgi:hypothetical protein
MKHAFRFSAATKTAGFERKSRASGASSIQYGYAHGAGGAFDDLHC